MRIAVGDIIELVGPDCHAGVGGSALFSKPGGVLHVVVLVAVGHGWHEDQLDPELAQGVLLLLALGLGHDDGGLVSARGSDVGDANTGVARRAFDDGRTGLERAGSLGRPDDAQRRAVLDRPARVHEFGLAENGAAGFFGCAAQVDQGGVADGINKAVAERDLGMSGHSIALVDLRAEGADHGTP